MYHSNKKILGVLLLIITFLAACGGGDESGVPMDSPLLDPASATMNQSSPGLFQARFETTAGDFVIEVSKDWAPIGADRFYNLVSNGFYDGVAFFRVIEGFMVQFGILSLIHI